MNAPTSSLKAPRRRCEQAPEDSGPNYWAQLAWLSAGASPLLAWRRAAGLSAGELAAAAGVELHALVAIEARKRAALPDELARLAATLGLGPGDLED